MLRQDEDHCGLSIGQDVHRVLIEMLTDGQSRVSTDN